MKDNKIQEANAELAKLNERINGFIREGNGIDFHNVSILRTASDGEKNLEFSIIPASIITKDGRTYRPGLFEIVQYWGNEAVAMQGFATGNDVVNFIANNR